MKKTALSKLGALVLFFAGAFNMAGAADWVNKPEWTIPMSCYEDDGVKKILESIFDKGDESTYSCTSGGQTYTVTREHIMAAVLDSGVPYGVNRGKLWPQGPQTSTGPNSMSTCQLQNPGVGLGFVRAEPTALNDGRVHILYDWLEFPSIPASTRLFYYYELNASARDDDLKNLLADGVGDAYKAFSNVSNCWFKEKFQVKVEKAFYSGSRTVPELPPPPDGGNPLDPTNPGAPEDTAVRCSIIDIPCSLRALFIPTPGFLTERLNSGIGLNVNVPITSSDGWFTDVTLAGQTFRVGASFAGIVFNEQTLDMFRFYAWWSTFLFLLAYLGVPFLGGRKGMADAALNDTVGASEREKASNDRAKANYDTLRADDSWK